MPDTPSPRTWIRAPEIMFDALQGEWNGDGLVTEGGTIVEHVAKGGAPTRPVARTIDASQCVMLPGLINTHHHFYQTLTRSIRIALNKPLFDWLRSLYPIWGNLNLAMIDASTRLACAELLLSGCTTSVDHHYVFPEHITDAIDQQVSSAANMGMRVVLTRGSMSLGTSAGGLPPDNVVQDHDQILADSERLISRYHDATRAAMCQIALAPCSPFSVTPELLSDTAVLAQQHGVALHTHLAETEDENQFCLAQFGRRPLDHMEACGWLVPGTWFAHGIHFDSEEIVRLGEAGVGVSHCPSSNMFLASGICKLAELEQAGVHVSVGVDGSASNDCSNAIQEVRQLLLLQRLSTSLQDHSRAPDATQGVPTLSHLDALRWATDGGARLLARPELGNLQVGSAADIALFDLNEARFSGCQDPLAAIVLSGAHRAKHVMVNGEWRVRDHALVDTDLAQLMADHHQLAQQLWQGM